MGSLNTFIFVKDTLCIHFCIICCASIFLNYPKNHKIIRIQKNDETFGRILQKWNKLLFFTFLTVLYKVMHHLSRRHKGNLPVIIFCNLLLAFIENSKIWCVFFSFFLPIWAKRRKLSVKDISKSLDKSEGECKGKENWTLHFDGKTDHISKIADYRCLDWRKLTRIFQTQIR